MTGIKATLTGIVEREVVGKGSKSEHEAIVLKRRNGTAIALKLVGTNAFTDRSLDHLVGKMVEVAGRLHDGTLLISSLGDIKVRGGSGPSPRQG